MSSLLFDSSPGEGNTIEQSFLRHVRLGKNVTIIQSHLKGSPEHPITVGDGATIIGSRILSNDVRKSFSFGPWNASSYPTSIGEDSQLFQANIENSYIGKGVEGTKCCVRHSFVGDHTEIRPFGSILLSRTSGVSLGSEVSKCVLEGRGFVSEHTASYLSLVAPSGFPILDEDGQEKVLQDLPNLTNIGAGTVFANYSGKPKPAANLDDSSGSLKGTSVLWGAFTAVNSVIVNRYEQPTSEDSLFDIIRNPNITTLGLGSFVEKKVTGRIPSFSYAGHPSPKSIEIGWVLEKHPGILLNILKKMQKKCKGSAHKLSGLIEGTIRLEHKILQEELHNPASYWEQQQLEEGIACFEKHLDGRWRIDEEGTLVTPWSYDETTSRWQPQNK